jgi:hypothetical protein
MKRNQKHLASKRRRSKKTDGLPRAEYIEGPLPKFKKRYTKKELEAMSFDELHRLYAWLITQQKNAAKT